MCELKLMQIVAPMFILFYKKNILIIENYEFIEAANC